MSAFQSLPDLLAERNSPIAEVKELRKDKALLDEFDVSGRQDFVQTHQISDDECEQELLGYFWATPPVQSMSCRDAIRATLHAAMEANK